MKLLISFVSFIVFALIFPRKFYHSLRNEIFNPRHDCAEDVSDKLKLFAMF